MAGLRQGSTNQRKVRVASSSLVPVPFPTISLFTERERPCGDSSKSSTNSTARPGNLLDHKGRVRRGTMRLLTSKGKPMQQSVV